MPQPADEILVGWLTGLTYPAHPGSAIVAKLDIETGLPAYGKLRHGVSHKPETYARAWRRLRQKQLLKYIFDIEEERDSVNKGKQWKVSLNTSGWHRVT
jgi:hypothetical protein